MTLPTGMLSALERLYRENPVAVERFFLAIQKPEHTMSVGLHFANHRLQYAEFRSTAK